MRKRYIKICIKSICLVFSILGILVLSTYREINLEASKRLNMKTSKIEEANSINTTKDNSINQIENIIIIENNDNKDDKENNEEINNVVEYETITPEVIKSPSGDEYSIIGNLEIEKINLNMSIISKTTQELMRISACRIWGPNPNEVGNLCIIGHNWRNTKLFSKVPTLEIGDTIKIKDLYENIIEYKIYDKYLVNPDNVECLNQETNGKRIVTLITCNDDSSQRYVFHAEEI